MLEKATTLLLRQLLDTISETEMIIEQQRQSLCSDLHFQPYSAFCRIDSYGREVVSANDIKDFIHQHNFCGTSIGECGQIVKTFDLRLDGLLNFEDFAQILLPCANRSLRCEAQRRPHSRVGRFEPLLPHIEQALASILIAEIDLHKRVKLQVKDLKK